MKKILFAIFILIGFAAEAQYIPMTAYGYKEKRIKPDTVLHIPVLLDTASLYTTDTSAQIRIFNGGIYWHYGYWRAFGTGSGGGSGIMSVYAGDCLVKINDSTLAFDPSCAFDTSILRGVYVDTTYKINDSVFRTCKGGTCWDIEIRGGNTSKIDTIFSFTTDSVVVNKKFRIPLTDTTHAKKGCGNIIYDTILEHYFGDVCINGVHDHWGCFDCEQTFTESDPIALAKTVTLNAGTNVTIPETATQALSLNPSWTINSDDLDAYHTVTQLNDSTYIICRPNATCDTIQFAAGGTGSPNSNVGAGYRWAVPNTNNIKTLFAGTNVTIDSVSNANGLTISSDDLDAFHTTTQLTDTSFTINRPNGIVDTIIINNLAPLVPEALFTAGYGATAGIPTGATVYYYQITGRSSGLFSTESDVQQATPLSGTLRSLTVVTFATQDPSGSLVITVRKNGVSTGLTVTIPGGSAAGVYTDNTHTVSLSQGDKLDYMGQNNASATATVITSVATIITQ